MLAAAVRARISILISGGTGAGKTTFLNMLSQYIPQNERLVTIEDAAELAAGAGKHRAAWKPGRPMSKARARSVSGNC